MKVHLKELVRSQVRVWFQVVSHLGPLQRDSTGELWTILYALELTQPKAREEGFQTLAVVSHRVRNLINHTSYNGIYGSGMSVKQSWSRCDAAFQNLWMKLSNTEAFLIFKKPTLIFKIVTLLSFSTSLGSINFFEYTSLTFKISNPYIFSGHIRPVGKTGQNY